MNKTTATNLLGIGVGLVIGLAVVTIGYVVIKGNPNRPTRDISKKFVYNIDPYLKVDPKLIAWRQVLQIPTGMKTPRGIAADAKGDIAVVGDSAVRLFSPEGKLLGGFTLTFHPTCAAFGPGGLLYIASRRFILATDTAGDKRTRWQDLGDRAVLTSLAAAGDDVYAADAGNKLVWHFDTDGKLLGKFAQKDRNKEADGLVVPSAHLDVVTYPDGLIRVTDPGRHRIEAYTRTGYCELKWGFFSAANVAGFPGCCNPTDLAVLPNGEFVTSEKGIPRVKVYAADGKFRNVVAAPKDFAPDTVGLDLATDPAGRVLVLDPVRKAVRIFVRKTAGPTTRKDQP